MVEWKKLGEICTSLPKAIIKQGELCPDGIYPVINSGVSLYGRLNKYNNESNAFTLASRGEYAGFITYLRESFWAGGLCYPYRSVDENLYLTKFLYSFLKSKEAYIMNTLVMRGGIPALNKADVDKISIPIPSLSEQERIVGILDTFTASIDNLKEQIAQRRKQYEYYRDQLLDLEGKEGVEMKTLGEVCIKNSNIRWNSLSEDKSYKYIDLSSVSLITHKINEVSIINRNTAPSRAQQIVLEGDILLGTTRPTLKRYCQVPKYLTNQICSTGFCVYRADKTKLLNRWILHNIASEKFWVYCEGKQQGAGYPCLSNSDAFSFTIPLPPLEEQRRIVGILDTFESSITNLESQLAAREQQYEYYRNKLLMFE